MNNQRGSVSGVLLGFLTAAVLVQSVLLIVLFRKASEAETNGGTAAADGRPTPISLEAKVQELRGQLATVAKAQAESDREIGEKLASLESSVATVAALGGDGAASVKGADLEDLVAKAVEKKIEEEVPNREGGEWKPSIDEFKDKLKLNEYQTQQAERILDDAKAEVFKLAGLKREDGTSKLDDLVAAIQDPVDSDGAMKDWFMSLFREKIPGREETYIAELIRMKDRAEKSLVEVMDADQARKMRRLNIDYLGVKTEYDPFAEYVQEALK